jgi:hypothetical protein
MGLGYLFIEAVFAASGWDNRAEAFATWALYLVILALALRLRRHIDGGLVALDACIPALILATAQYEVLIGTPNPAHGPIPLLLVILAPFCWVVRSGAGSGRRGLSIRARRQCRGGRARAAPSAHARRADWVSLPVLHSFFVLDTAVGRACWDACRAVLPIRGVRHPALPGLLFLLVANVYRHGVLGWIAVAFALCVVVVQAFVPENGRSIRCSRTAKRDGGRASSPPPMRPAATGAGFRVYPVEGAPQVQQMLEFLRQNRPNLFKP